MPRPQGERPSENQTGLEPLEPLKTLKALTQDDHLLGLLLGDGLALGHHGLTPCRVHRRSARAHTLRQVRVRVAQLHSQLLIDILRQTRRGFLHHLGAVGRGNVATVRQNFGVVACALGRKRGFDFMRFGVD